MIRDDFFERYLPGTGPCPDAGGITDMTGSDQLEPANTSYD